MTGEVERKRKLIYEIDGKEIDINEERAKDPNNYAYNLLSWALEKQDIIAIKFFTLPEIRMNIDTYQNGCTLLHVAAQTGDIKSAKLLIRCGANIDATSKDGYIALHIAAQKNHIEFARLLLTYGANVNSVNSAKSGITPLYSAVQEGNTKIVELLTERGANVNVRGDANNTPLLLATLSKNIEIAKLLIKHGAMKKIAVINNPSQSFSSSEYMNMLESVLARKASIYPEYPKNDDGTTCLHVAACDNNFALTEILINAAEEKEEYINVKNNRGKTALHIVANDAKHNKEGEEYQKILKLLLSNGANPHLRSDAGEDPLDVAIEQLCCIALWIGGNA
ncbi:ankyrin repeat domain-containing protein [Wolbachia endosymbiont of Ctenocephalides felis wCfeT]|uniref:ankyrin repeat domain-containing protein n=1 Tax=Wolbachia endosymbiont of Ctenocephalides felis wCfeT TaxID=2732593 RepID=UPI0014480D9B|nr:ankyrin repeat domain-containing protein [Wolbachia endosymbiont of Ctenocephalides felis wCfeT]